MNAVLLIGRIGQDLEIVKTKSGLSKLSFPLAVDGGATADGGRKTEWIDIEAWRTTAEFIDKWFNKGDPIVITGSLRAEHWNDKDGNRRKRTVVVANAVEFVPKSGTQKATGAAERGQNGNLNQKATSSLPKAENAVQGNTEAILPNSEFELIDDEDLPF